MAGSAATQSVAPGHEQNHALAINLSERFFTAGSAKDQASGAHLYTTKDGVPAMKEALKDAGLPNVARFNRESKTFVVPSAALSLRHAPAMAEILEAYGVGSPGHSAWSQERGREREAEGSLKTALGGTAVRTGRNVDLKAHEDGAILGGLVDQGVSPENAILVAGENRRRLESYGSGPRPDSNEILRKTYVDVRENPDHVRETLMAEASQRQADPRYGSETAARIEQLQAYVAEATVHLGLEAARSPAMPHDEVDDAVSMTVTDKHGQSTEWSMRFDVGTLMPNFVGTKGAPDPLYSERFEATKNIVAPYYSQFKDADLSVAMVRHPLDANAMRVLVSEKQSSKMPHEWGVTFKPGSSSEIDNVRLDGKPVALKDLREMSVERSPAARALAQRLNHEVTRKPETVLFVPPSERPEFDKLARETGATARYSSKVPSQYGRPGGYILMGGNPADFAKWQGPDAHARFVREGDEARRGTANLRGAAREVHAAAHEHPYARYMGVGLKMPQDPAKQQPWIDGFTEAGGRKHVGLKEANPEQLKELAVRTSQSYRDLESEEARIRLSVALERSPMWRGRYNQVQGTHEEKIDALLPREAADGKPGFLAINHDQNRHLWMVDDGRGGKEEAGLQNKQDKLALNSLGRGFAYLRDRFEEVTGQSLGFTVTGRRRDGGMVENAVDTTVEKIEVNAGKFGGRSAAAAASTASPGTATPVAAVAAKPAAPSVRRSSDGMDL